jgi:hypothetical protein
MQASDYEKHKRAVDIEAGLGSKEVLTCRTRCRAILPNGKGNDSRTSSARELGRPGEEHSIAGIIAPFFQQSYDACCQQSHSAYGQKIYEISDSAMGSKRL